MDKLGKSDDLNISIKEINEKVEVNSDLGTNNESTRMGGCFKTDNMICIYEYELLGQSESEERIDLCTENDLSPATNCNNVGDIKQDNIISIIVSVNDENNVINNLNKVTTKATNGHQDENMKLDAGNFHLNEKGVQDPETKSDVLEKFKMVDILIDGKAKNTVDPLKNDKLTNYTDRSSLIDTDVVVLVNANALRDTKVGKVFNDKDHKNSVVISGDVITTCNEIQQIDSMYNLLTRTGQISNNEKETAEAPIKNISSTASVKIDEINICNEIQQKLNKTTNFLAAKILNNKEKALNAEVLVRREDKGIRDPSTSIGEENSADKLLADTDSTSSNKEEIIETPLEKISFTSSVEHKYMLEQVHNLNVFVDRKTEQDDIVKVANAVVTLFDEVISFNENQQIESFNNLLVSTDNVSSNSEEIIDGPLENISFTASVEHKHMLEPVHKEKVLEHMDVEKDDFVKDPGDVITLFDDLISYDENQQFETFDNLIASNDRILNKEEEIIEAPIENVSISSNVDEAFTCYINQYDIFQKHVQTVNAIQKSNNEVKTVESDANANDENWNMDNFVPLPTKKDAIVFNEEKGEILVACLNVILNSETHECEIKQNELRTEDSNIYVKENVNVSEYPTFTGSNKDEEINNKLDKMYDPSDTLKDDENENRWQTDDANERDQDFYKRSRSDLVIGGVDETSLKRLIDLYSDDVRKEIKAVSNQTVRSPPCLDDTHLDLSEDEDEYCEYCNDRFESIYDMAKHRCDKKIFKSPTDFSSFNETLKKRRLFTPDPAETEILKYKSSVKIRSDKKKYGRGIDVGPYNCHLCNKTILRRSGLKIHLRRHMKCTPYKCEYCSKRFVVQYDLDRHTRTHLSDLRFKMCEVCKKPFVSKDGLFQHMKIAHPSQAKYDCKICKMTFAEKYRLKKHMAVHEKKKQTTVVEESIELLDSVSRDIRDSPPPPPLVESKTKKRKLIVSIPPLVVMKTPQTANSPVIDNNPTRSVLDPQIVRSKSSLIVGVPPSLNLRDRQVGFKKPPKTSCVSNSVVTNYNPVSLKEKSLQNYNLNELDVLQDLTSDVDLNEIQVLDLDETSLQESSQQQSMNESNIDNIHIGSVGFNHAKFREITNIEDLNSIKSLKIIPSNEVQIELIDLKDKPEYGSLDAFGLNYLNDENQNIQIISPPTGIEVGNFNNLNLSREMLELVDLIEANVPVGPIESTRCNQTNLHLANPNNAVSDAINDELTNKSNAINRLIIPPKQIDYANIYDSNCETMQSVDFIEAMDVIPSNNDLEGDVSDYIESPLVSYDPFSNETDKETAGVIQSGNALSETIYLNGNTTITEPVGQLSEEIVMNETNVVVQPVAPFGSTIATRLTTLAEVATAPARSFKNETEPVVNFNQPRLLSGSIGLLNVNQLGVVNNLFNVSDTYCVILQMK